MSQSRSITRRRRPTVLCLDDDPATLGSLERLLTAEPYDLVTTASPIEALKRLGRSPVDVVIADERMPDISGTAFLRMVEEQYPDTARLIVSGHPLVENWLKVDPELVHHFIPKPWNDDELRVLLRGILKHRGVLETPPPPPKKKTRSAPRRRGPDFMAEQPLLVECTGRIGAEIMTKVLPWLRHAKAEGRNVVAVLEGLPLLKDSPIGLLSDLVLAVEVTGVRMHLLEATGLAREFFSSSDAFHPRILLPGIVENPRDLLLVDPLGSRRVFLKLLLSALGHRCRAVATPVEARRALDADSFDRILMELTEAEDAEIELVRDLARTSRGIGVIPLLGVARVWSPSIARKWNLQRPLLRPYVFTELGDAVK